MGTGLRVNQLLEESMNLKNTRFPHYTPTYIHNIHTYVCIVVSCAGYIALLPPTYGLGTYHSIGFNLESVTSDLT